MYRKTIFACIMLVLYFGSFPAFSEIYAYPFNPEIGTSWIVHEHRTKTTNREGQTPVSEGEVFGRLHVKAHTPEGYLYEWTTTEVRSGGVRLTKENADPSFMIGLPIPFEAAADGTPIRVFEVDQLIETAIAGVEASGEEVSEETRLGIISVFSDTDAATLAATFLQQAELVGSCQNYELDSETPIEQEGYSPSFSGAPPILTKVKTELLDPGTADLPAIIVTRQNFDPESAQASMLELFTKMSADMGRPAPKPEEIPPIERSTTITCRIDTASGETSKVVSDVVVNAQGVKRTDYRELKITREN